MPLHYAASSLACLSAIERRSVRVGDNDLSMLVAGPEDGERVVLLHGIPENAELWRAVLSLLADAGYRGHAPDLPGYGATRMPPNADRSLAGTAELVAAWLQQERLAPAWIVGHDLGGGEAQILVVRHPELVSRLTLTDCAVTDLWPVVPIRVFQLTARLGLYPLSAALGLIEHNPYTWWAFRRGFANPRRLTRADSARVFFDGKVHDARGRHEFARHLVALDNRQTMAIESSLKDVRVPVLLAWGDSDRYQPWDRTGKTLQSLLPASEVALIARAGHFVPYERPAEYAQALIDWRRRS